MKRLRDPRVLIACLLLLVALIFLGSTMRLIGTARAADQASIFMKNEAGRVESTRFPTLASLSVDAKPELTGQVTPVPPETPGDTAGIIALAIVIVVTIVLGAAVGVRNSSTRKISPK